LLSAVSSDIAHTGDFSEACLVATTRRLIACEFSGDGVGRRVEVPVKEIVSFERRDFHGFCRLDAVTAERAITVAHFTRTRMEGFQKAVDAVTPYLLGGDGSKENAGKEPRSEGFGKSTSINLITRFYDVDKGAVEIDGRDVRSVTLSSLHRQIGVVLQEPFLFHGTIAQNITYGKPDACVAINTADGAEIGFIDDIGRLDRVSQEVLRTELERSSLLTRLTGIDDVKSNHGMTTWQIRTDRGPRPIYVKDRGEIRWLQGGKVVMTDINGLKYTIENLDDLDARSRIMLESET